MSASPLKPQLHVIDASTLQVCWSAVPGASKYAVIVHDSDEDAKYVDWATGSLRENHGESSTGPETCVIVKNLKPNVPYHAQVAAMRGNAWSEYSPCSSALRLPQPSPPSAPSLQVVTGSSLQVSWSAVVGASHYAVIVDDGGTKFVDWVTGSLRTDKGEASTGIKTSVIVKGLTPNMLYQAQVAAKHGSTWSEYSPFSSALRLPKPTPPPAPSLQVVSSSTLQVSWSAVPGASSYGVVVDDGEAKFVDWVTGSLQKNQSDSSTGSQTSVVVVGLKPEIRYKARVAAKQDGEWSEYSSYSSPLRLPKPTAPSLPSLQVVSDSSLQVSWSAVPGATRYGVILDDGDTKFVDWATGSLQKEQEAGSTGCATVVIVKGLKTDVLYKARVAAKQGEEWSEYSSPSAGIKLQRLPETPVVEVVNDSMFVVSWPEVAGASKYDVIVDNGRVHHVNWNTNHLEQSCDDSARGSSTSVVVKNLQSDIPYRAKVAALVNCRWTEYSPFSESVKLGQKRRHCVDCVICMSEPATVALDPCGHMCTCETCSTAVRSCPMCRGTITKRLRIY